MLPQSNQAARQLTQRPQTARQDTLDAISQHLNRTGSRINRLSAAQQRVQDALTCPIPDQTVSRIDWIAKRLNSQQ